MLDLAPGLAALLLYTGLALWRSSHTATARHWLTGIAVLALCLHGISVYQLIDTGAGFHFGFFHVASLIFWVVCVTVLISSLTLPVGSLLSPLFGLTAISIACSLLINSSYTPRAFSYPIAIHILLSILAYSLLTIASAQALALALQDKLLKSGQLKQAMSVLPPLQTMEALLFEMLWAGTALLALSIASGLLFLDDIRAQHLTHKMFFSLIALVVYSILLWGRHAQGWRGKQAIRWALGGFLTLMLAYFGSKLVLELLLHKG
jgi:ABC-type uncharacterized transport system permease subunit